MQPWFFLSYGRRDDIGDGYVRFFYERLAHAVAEKVGLPSEIKVDEVGFLDRSAIEPGDYWSAKIAAGLQACRTLVCLLSPSYLKSEYCGKELQAFLERLEQFDPEAPLILPILWDRPEKVAKALPNVLSIIQFPHDTFGKIYAREGLGYLVRRPQSEGFKEFVHRFALRLVKVAEDFILPETRDIRPLEEIKSALHSSEALPGLAAKPAGGPNVARFVFVAGCIEDLKIIRKKTEYYGPEGGRDWCPYYPESQEAVGVLSQRVAADEGLFYESLAVDQDLMQRIRKAEETNTIVLLLVDPWSVRIERYERHMRDFDQNLFLNCGLLIPWNEADEETLVYSSKLRTHAESILMRCFISHGTYMRDCIRSSGELQQEISTAIGEVRRRMMQRAEVFKKISDAESSSVPTISGAIGERP